MGQRGLVIEDAQNRPRFYALTTGGVREVSYLKDPFRFLRAGSIEHEAVPDFRLFIYKLLWRYKKLNAGYIDNQGVLSKIKCSGFWWGWYVFEALRSWLPNDCIVILGESPGIFCWLEVSDGKLQKYRTGLLVDLSATLLKSEISHCFTYGLSEEELLRFPKGITQLELKLGTCQSVEEFVARKILIDLSGGQYSRWLFFIAGLSFVNTITNVFYIYSSSEALNLLESQREQIGRHIVSKSNPPKRIYWIPLLKKLFSSSEIEVVEIYKDKITVQATNHRKIKNILRKSGFIVIEKEETLLLAEKQHIIEAVK